MLKSLDYSVEFPTTGRSFSNRIEFEPGLTAITGRNEAGKTLIFEMIGCAFFGKDALRGAASDYRNLALTVEAEVKGEKWKIERARKESFWVNGDLVAVGAAAINTEVPKRLGFGIDVWNIAVASQQGDIGRLTEMRPTARRAMVDRLIGLDQIEAVEKACKAEATKHQTVASALAVEAVEPVEPVPPEVMVTAEELAEVEAQQRERERLLRIDCPEKPEPPAVVEGDVDELERHEAERQRLLQERARIEGQLASIPEPRHAREELERALAYKDYQDEVARRGPRPDVNLDLLREMDRVLDIQQRAGQKVECPKCFCEFHLGLSQDEAAHLEDVVPLTKAEITREFRRHEIWAEPLEEVEPFTIENIQQEIRAHADNETRLSLLGRLTDLGQLPDRSGDLRAVRAYGEALAVFAERNSRYDSGLREYEATQARAAGIPDRADELPSLRDGYTRTAAYLREQAVYEDARARYEALRDKVGESRAAAEAYSMGATSLRGVRGRVQSELVPSLSRAASTLLSALTGGERSRVSITPDFEISVDSQPLGTLSGSGKSVVNLALRLGLGQVLTARVLPIFMGDEIDADCDSNRSSSIHQTISGLKQFLKQVVMITHKNDFEADQVITL